MWREYLSLILFLVLMLLTAFGATTLWHLAGMITWASWIMGCVTTFGLIDIINKLDPEGP